jgi:Domain of unknown function (DUF6378)
VTDNLRAQTLDEAARLVNNDRNKDYGEPINDFSKVVGALNSFGYSGPGGRDLEPHDLAFIQTVVKLSRLVQTPTKVDSWVDIAGYAACGREVAEQFAKDTTPAPVPVEKPRAGMLVNTLQEVPQDAVWQFIHPSALDQAGKLKLTIPSGQYVTYTALLKELVKLRKSMGIHVRDTAMYGTQVTPEQDKLVYTWVAVMGNPEEDPDAA